MKGLKYTSREADWLKEGGQTDDWTRSDEVSIKLDSVGKWK